MDLLTYLEQKNELALYEKMQELVDLHREKGIAKEVLSRLNKDYNELLTIKIEKIEEINDIKRKSVTPIEKIGDKIANKLDDLNPLLIMGLFMMLPLPIIVLVMIILLPLILFYRFTKVLRKRMIDSEIKKALGEINLAQNILFDQVCEVRKNYHDTRKKYEHKISALTPKELELLQNYCALEDEYAKLVDEYIQKIEILKQEQELPEKPQTTISEIKLSKIM